MDFTRSQGIADADVRIVPRPFTEKTTDRPELFRSTFDERARSQNWTHREKDIARITAIRDEIISNYLPLGFTADHVDDRTGEIRLHEEQKLHIYQAMCRQFRKAEYDTIPECLDELKYTKPYVNLLDLIDVFRTDQEVPIFYDWDAFKKCTLKGRTINQKDAEESEFLAPLLQNLRKGLPEETFTGERARHRPVCDSYRPSSRTNDNHSSKTLLVKQERPSPKRPDTVPVKAVKAEPQTTPVIPDRQRLPYSSHAHLG
jgi:hypothetical protein